MRNMNVVDRLLCELDTGLRTVFAKVPASRPRPAPSPDDLSIALKETDRTESIRLMRELWARTTRTTAPIALLREKLDPGDWPRVEAGVLGRLLEMFGDGPQTIPMPANLIVGRRPA